MHGCRWRRLWRWRIRLYAPWHLRGARRFCEALAERGLLCKETHENVLRFAPPLVIDRATIDWALGPIGEVLSMD